ncbi:disease resistance protein RPV1-like isoform X2 [Eucalyptus grandis]|uniref:disease resistance protein RPV1-like isoform X2 n=1 Tax=Eucalyptus grandis TaxID=71139 RepID=UPI00192ED996|nr:disease resistance protein RPV1-like isoform X2 [Eucalyptus grandis]
MDVDQSLQLFSRHAFRQDYPLDEYIGQSMRAIGIARGLPLALEVIGSLLCRTKKEKWDLTLKKWENVPPPAIQKEAMEVLQNMSLIKIEEENIVWMHDQLRDLGRAIVREKSNKNIKEQSRVWDPKEGLDLLRKHKGEKKVEALRLNLDNHQQYRFSYEGFENISNLRFLEVDGLMENFRAEKRLLWHESPSNVLPLDDFQENSYLLPQLRWLSWPKIPPTFKITNFSMEDVVILNLSESKITHDWKGWSHMKVMKNLKVMNLKKCNCLERTPDFSTHSKLERLILQRCYKLVEIDKSVCQLKRLVFLDVTWCRNLRRLPDEMGRDLASLKYLYMNRCSLLEGLPNTIGNLKSLNELDISGMGIKELPDTLWTIEKLEVIKANFVFDLDMEIDNCIYRNRSLRILELICKRIRKVPRLPESLTILKLSGLYTDTFLDLSNLTNLKELYLNFGPRDSDGESDGPVEEGPMPSWIGNLSKLESLDLRSPYVTALPTDIRSLLPQLKSLSLYCPKLRCFPSLPSSLLSLHLSSKCATALPMDMSSLLPRLKELKLGCPNLRCLRSLPSSLSELSLYDCKSGCSMEDLSNLKTLSFLRINDCAISEIRGLDRLENLRSLSLLRLQQVQISLDLSNLNKLRYLLVSSCGNLAEIQGELPPSLDRLDIQSCESLQKLPDLSNLKGPQHVQIKGCGKLNVEDLLNLKTLSYLHITDYAISEIRGLDRFENLRSLLLWKLQQVEILPDLSNLNKLAYLHVYDCGNLVEIQGELPPSLERLVIGLCRSLQKLPDLSSLRGLREVGIEYCRKLNVEAISSLCSEKGVEFKRDETRRIRG